MFLPGTDFFLEAGSTWHQFLFRNYFCQELNSFLDLIRFEGEFFSVYCFFSGSVLSKICFACLRSRARSHLPAPGVRWLGAPCVLARGPHSVGPCAALRWPGSACTVGPLYVCVGSLGLGPLARAQ